MGVQLPESTPSIPLPLQLEASNKSIKIQRQLLFPQLEKKFISILLYPAWRYVELFVIPCRFCYCKIVFFTVSVY